jgi:hypothetical protein
MATASNPGDGSKRLLNYKHELVARYVAVQGLHPNDAVRKVYDVEGRRTSRHIQSEANRICICNPAVTARIAYLTESVILRDVTTVATTREWVEGEMVKTYQEASNDGSWAAAVKALELLGVDKGMFIRKTQIEHNKKTVNATNREELIEQFIQLATDAFGPIPKDALRAIFAKATGAYLSLSSGETPQEVEVASSDGPIILDAEPTPGKPDTEDFETVGEA